MLTVLFDSAPQFPLLRTSQTLKWEGVWRELGCLARTASFAVRQESGHSLKSSLSVTSPSHTPQVTGHCRSQVTAGHSADCELIQLDGSPMV